MIWTDIEESDYALVKANKLPGRLIGSHSLEAWGFRLGKLKGDFGKKNDWSHWTPEMQSYCEQDVEVGADLFHFIEAQQYSEVAIQLEHDFAAIIYKMEQRGFAFDLKGATELYGKLVKRREELYSELQRVFPPKTVEWETPKKKQKRSKVVPFSPASRKQVAERLMELGWKPTKKTEGGAPAVDEQVLEHLPYPEAKPLAEYFLIQKRIGQLAEGSQAWIKSEKNGRVYHRVVTNGTVTGRCTHHSFNITQVPKVTSPYGPECRALFTATPGMKLVGADASGLELRCLAHYLARYDGGEYAKTVCEGDIHSLHRDAFGLPPTKEGRDNGKTATYGHLYGGQEEVVGAALKKLSDEHEAKAQQIEVPPAAIKRMAKRGPVTPDRIANWKRGRYGKNRIMSGIKGFQQLVDDVMDRAFGPVVSVTPTGRKIRDKSKGRGYLVGLDGRKLKVRSEHSCLNTLLQSAGAILMKKAVVLWYEELIARGYQWDKDFGLCSSNHDEVQADARPEIAEEVGQVFVDSIVRAGQHFKFRCPVTGTFAVGDNWKETH